MTKLFRVHDEFVQLRERRVSNKLICCVLSVVQLWVTALALGQHVYSLAVYEEVLHCDFNATGAEAAFLGSDIIIFDIGLFHRLWGIEVGVWRAPHGHSALEGCIANHLDGGYGRFGWCVSHTAAIISFLFTAAFVRQPRAALLWPMLTQQSAYGIGLLILSLAALPKLLPWFVGQLEPELVLPMLVYIAGASCNFFLLYVLWHWYWHVEAEQAKRAKAPTTRQTRPHLIVNGSSPRVLLSFDDFSSVRQPSTRL